MTFRTPRLEIDATIDGSQETGVFEFGAADEDQWQVSMRLRTGPLVDNAASQIFAIFGDVAGIDGLENRGITIDRGGGEFAVEIRGEPHSGEVQKREGGVAQWGASSDPDTFNATTATGASAAQKMQVFQNYFRQSSTDSISPATLSLGEYSSGGVYEPLEVVVEEPSADITNSKPGFAPVELVCVETIALDSLLDGESQTEA